MSAYFLRTINILKKLLTFCSNKYILLVATEKAR
uniref:Uncharacterized protein n=1 Tax=Caudovirales sp. ctXjW8 TaxID=2826779 RepID=A0A8S5N516_9CAUD|nr:MAG TPA: hypothetical protein [Caudovirales sp. ctXjW8]